MRPFTSEITPFRGTLGWNRFCKYRSGNNHLLTRSLYINHRAAYTCINWFQIYLWLWFLNESNYHLTTRGVKQIEMDPYKEIIFLEYESAWKNWLISKLGLVPLTFFESSGKNFGINFRATSGIANPESIMSLISSKYISIYLDVLPRLLSISLIFGILVCRIPVLPKTKQQIFLNI